MKKISTLLFSLSVMLYWSISAHAATREPLFITMTAHPQYDVNEALSWFKVQYHLPKGSSFRLLNKLNDKLGYTHYRFIQTYNGIDIHSAMWLVHTKTGKVESMNGMIVTSLPMDQKTTLNEPLALARALTYVNAQQYKWQIPAEELWLKRIRHDSKATWYPTGQLLWVSTDINDVKVPFKLCYAFDIYAQTPMSRQVVYIDAHNGAVVWHLDKLMTGNPVKDTANTVYSGKQVIVADSFSPTLRTLNDSLSRCHIRTLNLQQGTNYGAAIDFTNATHYWNDTNAAWDQYATDAHWATEVTYDFYKKTFNRRSVDDSDHALFSYVHYSTSYYNAFWDGNEMTYGDGYGQPLTALDITGHEISHGVTQYTAGLNYINESGALNEGFSDCMGKSVEHFARAWKFAWPISDDMTSAFRDMSNPKLYGQATTYKGPNWYVGSSDNGGVHQNNSILTYWYYLLCIGGKGRNDNGDSFVVHRLGIDTAEQILYRAQSVYNIPSTQYKDARFNTIRAAVDFYGACSPQVKEVTNAWYAVGVGDSFQNKVISVIYAQNTDFCSLPADAQFYASNSANASSFKWYFGDGDSSSLSNPLHTYKKQGKYDVRLIADGGKCGTDDSTARNYISIVLLPSPIVKNDTLCAHGADSLSVIGGGTNYYIWYDSATGGKVVDTGIKLHTPFLSNSATYFVEQSQRTYFMQPVDTTIGKGYVFIYPYSHGIVFNALIDFTLKSVQVYSDTADYRQIDLIDSTGNIIAYRTVMIPTGGSRVTLNMIVPRGNGYMLALDPTATTHLFRDTSGASFPYRLNGVVDITGTDLGLTKPGYYYFFYNWEVQAGNCKSPRTAATVVVPAGVPVINISGSNIICMGSTTTLTVPAGYTYKWNTGDTSRSLTVHASGVFNVRATTGKCVYYSANDTVSSKLPPTITLTPSGIINLCSSRTISLSVLSNAHTIKWSNGDTTPTTRVSHSGIYTVYTNNGYCNSKTDTTIIVSITTPTAAAMYKVQPTKYDIKFNNKSTGGTSYDWYLAGGKGHSTATDSFTYSYTGGYPKAGDTVTDTVTLIAVNNGCGDTVKIPVKAVWKSTNFIDIYSSVNMQLYPNPSDVGTHLVIGSTRNGPVSVCLYDATGRITRNVFDGMITGGKAVLYFNTQSLSNGTYILKTTFDGGRTLFNRLIISH